MHFLLICRDKPDSEAVRLAARPDHLAYVAGLGNTVVFAGPMLTDDGEHMTGSVLVIDVNDRAAAEAFATNDPYGKAGLFESVEIQRFRQVVPS